MCKLSKPMITKVNCISTSHKSYTFSASRWADAMYIKGEEKRKYYLSSLSPPKNSLRPKKKNWIQRTEAAEHRINLAEKKWRRSIATGQWPQIIQKHQVPIETWVYWFMYGVIHKLMSEITWLQPKLCNQVCSLSPSRWKTLTLEKIKVGWVLWCIKVQICKQ